MFLAIIATALIVVFSFFSLIIISFDFTPNYNYLILDEVLLSKNINNINFVNIYDDYNLLDNSWLSFYCYSPDYVNYSTWWIFSCLNWYIPPNFSLNVWNYFFKDLSELNLILDENIYGAYIRLLNLDDWKILTWYLASNITWFSIQSIPNWNWNIKIKNNNLDWSRFNLYSTWVKFYEIEYDYYNSTAELILNYNHNLTQNIYVFNSDWLYFNTWFNIPPLAPHNFLWQSICNDEEQWILFNWDFNLNEEYLDFTYFNLFTWSIDDSYLYLSWNLKNFLDIGYCDLTLKSCENLSLQYFSTWTYNLFLNSYICINSDCDDIITSPNISEILEISVCE